LNKNYNNIKVIGFDADDTLWVNETYFRDAEKEFAKLLSQFETENKIDQELFKKEIENLPTYGYGIKGFTLSMVEMALELSNYTISNHSIEKILDIGKRMINQDVELLPDIENVLKKLSENYKLIVITKGDLLDQSINAFGD
jgi:putative hydrolase of the HAD superfamily